MRGRALEAWKGWNRFWFESEAVARIRLFRFGLGLLLFFLYAVRSLDLSLFFSERGIMPLAAVPDLLPMDFRKSLFFLFPGDAALWAGNAVLLVSLLAMAFGILPRVAAATALVLNISFLHRDMAPTYGVDMIATFFLFYLAFADTRPRRSPGAPLLSSMACRLVQLQLCIIYGYSGLDKVKGPQWWSGEALWGVVSNVQLSRFDFSFFAHFPLALVIVTYATLVWEIYFPVLVWNRRLRGWVLAFGLALHIGIGAMVNIPYFAGLMMLAYISFMDEATAALWVKRLRLPRFGQAS